MSTAASELVRAVSIGEGVKQIVLIAGKVRSIATNAILLAHRAGDLARGFGVLSRELRGFTDQVTTQMNILGECTFELVTEVSGLLRHTHRSVAMRRAVGMLPPQSAQVGAFAGLLARHVTDGTRRMKTIERLHGRLGDALAATDQVAQYGIVLARTALIEAAYGGEHSQSLTGVAREFNDTILDITEALRGVRSATRGSVTL